ncbi:MAG TPA: HNH endonuclease [Candidatus Paceibacterota bacterium]|nr:HNH endonuclease [Candidatus Paceibacterota bacterium]
MDGLEETPALAALLAAYDGRPLSLDAQTQSTGCSVEGALPDPRCTPGAVFAEASTSDICTPGYSRSVRNVSVKTKRQIYAAYGIDYPQPTGSYEADHLIPLELGGSNDTANLFPEAAKPTPGFHEKDLVENYLHDEVCAGVIGLAAAQEQIARDWLAVYNTLTPATIAALKRQAASFGD